MHRGYVSQKYPDCKVVKIGIALSGTLEKWKNLDHLAIKLALEL